MLTHLLLETQRVEMKNSIFRAHLFQNRRVGGEDRHLLPHLFQREVVRQSLLFRMADAEAMILYSRRWARNNAEVPQTSGTQLPDIASVRPLSADALPVGRRPAVGRSRGTLVEELRRSISGSGCIQTLNAEQILRGGCR